MLFAPKKFAEMAMALSFIYYLEQAYSSGQENKQLSLPDNFLSFLEKYPT